MANPKWLVTVAVLGLAACAPKDPQGADAKASAAGGPLTWTAAIQPIVQHDCANCHVTAAAAGLSLESYGAFATKESSACSGLTIPQAMAAKVSAEWSATCTGARMPISGEMSADEIQTLRDWAEAGAPE